MSSIVSRARNDSPTRIKFGAVGGGACLFRSSGKRGATPSLPKLGLDIVVDRCLDRPAMGMPW